MALKKIDRKISWDLYLSAFAISLVVFAIGVWVGLQIEQSVADQVSEVIDQTNGRMLSMSNLLLMEEDPLFCTYLEEEMAAFDYETYLLGQQIGTMEERRGVEDSLKIKYMDLEFRDYLLSKKINERCQLDQNIVLYFVSSLDCADCKKQGEALSEARSQTNTRVYTFDIGMESGLIDSLKQKYSVTSVPAMIINGDPYEGYRASSELVSILNSAE